LRRRIGPCATRLLRIERRASVEVANRAGESELRHFDGVAGRFEDERLPISALCVNFNKILARLDHHGVEIARCLAIAVQFQIDFGARVRRRKDLSD
jgi:hypothetical protein